MFLSALFNDKKAVKAELKASFSLIWPIVMTNLAQTAMVTINLSLMGWENAETLAAGALGTNLFYIFMVFGTALMTAISPVIAVELGRNRHAVKEIQSSVRQVFWTAIIIVIPIWCILWNSEGIFLLMRQDPESSRIAGHYTFVLMWSLAPLYGYMILRSFFATLERPGWTLVFGLGAVFLDFLIAWSLMFGKFGMPRLGLTGIGIAIFCADSFMFLGLVIISLCDRQIRRYWIFSGFFRPDWARFRAIWRIGLPIAIAATFETTVFSVAGFAMKKIGTEQMAAHSIAIQISSISFMVPFGIAQAVTVRVGRSWGARDLIGMQRAGWTCIALTILFMSSMAAIMTFFPMRLIQIFLDIRLPENAEVIAYAKQFLVFAALFQIADGTQTVSSGMLRGLHDTKVPMMLAGLGYWGITIPLGLFLAFHTSLSGLGIWVGLAVGLSLAAILLLSRWIRKSRSVKFFAGN